ncbi:MAG: hypothetical protein GWP08_13135 [Nitrospiraceae bacterium]|nr:hypothetical protein [Nitrospiraceae bacterium]
MLIGMALLVGIVLFRFAYTTYGPRRRFLKHWAEGLEAIKRKDFAAAEKALRVCVRAIPSSAVAQRMLGGTLARQGNLAEAEERIRFGVDLEPRNGLGHAELGVFLTLFAPGRAQEALDAFREALTHTPELRDALAKDPRLANLHQDETFRELMQSDDDEE